ncbi:MAG TPA: hypothetical protein VLG91_16380 [Streptomyces sp.]|nr:hypothetical protein [Streptomyces sp.]
MSLVACEGGGLNTGAVAFTTDRLGTEELEREGLDVRWLTCTASYDSDAGAGGDGDGDGEKQGGGRKPGTPSASAATVADVDCTGEDKEGRDISLTGKVTKEVNGRCVRGDLTAKVGGKEWFHVEGLGNCDAPDPSAGLPDPDRPGPTVTVTVTQTIWCQKDPACVPEGK